MDKLEELIAEAEFATDSAKYIRLAYNLGKSETAQLLTNRTREVIEMIPDIDWGEYNPQVAELKQELKKKYGI